MATIKLPSPTTGDGSVIDCLHWYIIPDKINLYILVYEYDGEIHKGDSFRVETPSKYGDLYPDYYFGVPPFTSTTVKMNTLMWQGEDSVLHTTSDYTFKYLTYNRAQSRWDIKGATSQSRGFGGVYNEYTGEFYSKQFIWDTAFWLKGTNGALLRINTLRLVVTPGWQNATVNYNPGPGKLGTVKWYPGAPDAEMSPSYMLLRSGAYFTAESGSYGSTFFPADSDISKVIIQYIENDDPYGDSEDPKDGGGDGSHDQWTDKAGDDPEPTLSLTGTGMVTPYAPTLDQLKSFSRFLWSDAFSADTFKKIFSDPFQAIITCHALPFTVTSGVAVNVAFGNISSDVSMNTLASQYYTIDAGTLNISEYWGSFFDYSPFTSYMIYLPYVGYKEIRPEDFTTGSITVKYIVDAITGAFTVRLLSSKVNGSALYQYTGDMAYSIPLSKSDYSSIISNILSSAAAIGGGIAALAATGSAAALGSAAVSTVGKVTSSKVQVQRSGSVGGAAGWYASQTPYIIRTRPNPVLASNQNYFVGRPSYQTATLSTLSGYTKVKDIRLSGITGTDSEKAEIESLLKEGVIL